MIGLIGDLGCGKTVFVRGVAAGMDLPADIVTSPTFVFMNIYSRPFGGRRLIHLDLYRLASSEEIVRLGLLEEAGPDDATVIEWADRAKDFLPPDAVRIVIEDAVSSGTQAGETRRTITIEDFSDHLKEPT